MLRPIKLVEKQGVRQIGRILLRRQPLWWHFKTTLHTDYPIVSLRKLSKLD